MIWKILFISKNTDVQKFPKFYLWEVLPSLCFMSISYSHINWKLFYRQQATLHWRDEAFDLAAIYRYGNLCLFPFAHWFGCICHPILRPLFLILILENFHRATKIDSKIALFDFLFPLKMGFPKIDLFVWSTKTYWLIAVNFVEQIFTEQPLTKFMNLSKSFSLVYQIVIRTHWSGMEPIFLGFLSYHSYIVITIL